MNNLCRLNSDFFVDNRNLKKSFGVYYIIALNKKGGPKTIPRCAGLDKKGILYIGKGGNSGNSSLYTRLQAFWGTTKKKKKKNSGSHTAGNNYRSCNAQDKFPREQLGVCWKRLRKQNLTDNDLKKEEKKHINAYVNEFKELPPLNHSCPKET